MTAVPGAGRYAPSPSGDLHLGNLRTALIAWLWARSTDRRFLMRVEDLDRARSGSAERQLADLAALGLEWDGPVIYQTEHLELYANALATLESRGLVYECYCSRADIQGAVRAPHSPPGAYPGTCRHLTQSQRSLRRREIAPREPSLRLAADIAQLTITDEISGPLTGAVDDMVLRRGDGTYAYNLAVVVDDADMGVDQVVRGDDLLSSTPRQVYLQRLLGLPTPQYGHVPLILGPTGDRLAKRDGAVTLRKLGSGGVGPMEVLSMLARSLDLLGPGELATAPGDLLPAFSPERLPTSPYVWRGEW